jgi:hypothetical protein
MRQEISCWIFWSPGQENRLASFCENSKAALEALGLSDVPVCTWGLDTEEGARALRVYGTPSIKINCVDIEQDVLLREEPGLRGRKYMLCGREIEAPTVLRIKEAIIDALARQVSCGR